jgi:hypothetical protein
MRAIRINCFAFGVVVTFIGFDLELEPVEFASP